MTTDTATHGQSAARQGPASPGNPRDPVAAAECAERAARADGLIKNHVLVAMTFGLVPLPLFDLVLLVGNQAAMINAISRLYGVPFKEHRTKAIILALVAGSTPVLGVVGLSSTTKLIPGIGSLAGSAGVAVGGGALTYAVGRVFTAHFESGGTLLDFDVEGMRGLFKRETENGRGVAAKADQPQ